VPDPSAQADITSSMPRIHSPQGLAHPHQPVPCPPLPAVPWLGRNLRALRDLRDRGLISMTATGAMRIVDEAGLRAEAEG
jgi:hypothetical protein